MQKGGTICQDQDTQHRNEPASPARSPWLHWLAWGSSSFEWVRSVVGTRESKAGWSQVGIARHGRPSASIGNGG